MWLAGCCKWGAGNPGIFPGAYESKLEVFADASLNGEKTQGMGIKHGGGKSRAGGIMFLFGGPISWFTKKIKIIMTGVRGVKATALFWSLQRGCRLLIFLFDLIGISKFKCYSGKKALVGNLDSGQFSTDSRTVLQMVGYC